MKILTLDIGGTAIKSAIMNEFDQLRDIRITPSGTLDTELLVQTARVVLNGYEDYDVLAVSMSGQIDDKTQTVLFQYNKKTDSELMECPVGKMLYDK